MKILHYFTVYTAFIKLHILTIDTNILRMVIFLSANNEMCCEFYLTSVLRKQRGKFHSTFRLGFQTGVTSSLVLARCTVINSSNTLSML